MFDTQNIESINNATKYITQKTKSMAHIMSLNNRIYCVVRITIFGFKKYRKIVFDFMEINMIPTSKNI